MLERDDSLLDEQMIGPAKWVCAAACLKKGASSSHNKAEVLLELHFEAYVHGMCLAVR